jgi:hypothetical protein
MVDAACPGPASVGGIRIDVTGGNGSDFQVLPGTGLGKLRAVSAIEINNFQTTWSNTNLAFLSSLRCSGRTNFPSKVTSLMGLDNIVDGVADAEASYTVFYLLVRVNLQLTNVTALNAYARCGTPTQRPDVSGLPRPLVRVQPCTDILDTWATLCNYMRFGACPGTPLRPQPPPRPPPPPSPRPPPLRPPPLLPISKPPSPRPPPRPPNSPR